MRSKPAALFLVLAVCAVSCSSGQGADVGAPCSLVTSAEVAHAIHGTADTGRAVRAIGEAPKRMCTFHVSTALQTVTVYVRRGNHLVVNGNCPKASAIRNGVVVTVAAQNDDPRFCHAATELAAIALRRALR